MIKKHRPSQFCVSPSVLVNYKVGMYDVDHCLHRNEATGRPVPGTRLQRAPLERIPIRSTLLILVKSANLSEPQCIH